MAKVEYSSSGFEALDKTFEAILLEAQNHVLIQRDRIITLLTEKILALTPVWEGTVISNFRWFVGAPESGFTPAIDTGPPGQTSKMGLGQEPRRAANEAQARKSVASVLQYRGFADIYLSNSAPNALALEYGLLPSKGLSRNPRGMVRLAVAELMGGSLR